MASPIVSCLTRARLRRVVRRFRRAFDMTDRVNAPGVLPQFPRGCCGWAARFMGNYLRDHFKMKPLHIYAMSRKGDGGHEWIEVDGVVLDVTLDQFEPGLPKAHVGPLLPIHRQFEVTRREKPSPISVVAHIGSPGGLTIGDYYANWESAVGKRWPVHGAMNLSPFESRT
jgi:hypothetical protein